MDSPYRITGRVAPRAARPRRRRLTPARLVLAVVVAMVGFGAIGVVLASCALFLH